MELQLSLARWANFYVITSTAAAALIGLLFVVITLAAQRRVEDAKKIRVYLTPTVVHFTSILIVAALLTFPTQTRYSGSLCVGLMGFAGAIYSGLNFSRRRQENYAKWRDTIPYAGLPLAGYFLLLSGGIEITNDVQSGLTAVAISILLLLTIAIRNSWAIAVGVVANYSDPH